MVFGAVQPNLSEKSVRARNQDAKMPVEALTESRQGIYLTKGLKARTGVLGLFRVSWRYIADCKGRPTDSKYSRCHI
jgi:hypothetical protein